MKAETIINKITAEQVCSIHTCELLTKALHRENKLALDRAVRFRPLFGDFDIVNADYEENGVTAGYIQPVRIEALKDILFK